MKLSESIFDLTITIMSGYYDYCQWPRVGETTRGACARVLCDFANGGGGVVGSVSAELGFLRSLILAIKHTHTLQLTV